MSQYLVPIDEGDEIQHLGRTLECTLCGLRGKRCHLTLHFKAKHSEVIDLHIPGRNMNSGGATQITNTGIKMINYVVWIKKCVCIGGYGYRNNNHTFI